MSKTTAKIPRRQQILQALAKMLEDNPGERITTAALAKIVGVSEAALYRHFPSKTKMFEGLIESIETTIFGEISLVLSEEKSALMRCEKIVGLLLAFAERNPGLARLLVGDALTGETERLRQRVAVFFEHVELKLQQLFGEPDSYSAIPVAIRAHLLMAYVDGCITQFVRSEFRRLPTSYWPTQWQLIAATLL